MPLFIYFDCCLLIQIKYYLQHQHHDDDDPQGEYSGALPDADGLCARSVTACGKPDLMQYQVFNHHHDHDHHDHDHQDHDHHDHDHQNEHLAFVIPHLLLFSKRDLMQLRGEQAACNFLIHFLQLVKFSSSSAHSLACARVSNMRNFLQHCPGLQMWMRLF